MTLEQLISQIDKEVDKKTYPWIVSVLEDMEKNPQSYERYLKMKNPMAEILDDNA